MSSASPSLSCQRERYATHTHECSLLDEIQVDFPTDPIFLLPNFHFVLLQARIRVQLSAVHTPEQIDKAIAAFTEVGKKLKVVQ